MSLLSQRHHSWNPDVLASPSAAGLVCLQYAGATYTPRLFSPLADVSTSSGMHSSCPSFANVTDVCLAVCKIRSPGFFFLSLALFSLYFHSLKKETLHCNRPNTEDRRELLASSSDSIRPVIIYSLCCTGEQTKIFIQVRSKGGVEEARMNTVYS